LNPMPKKQDADQVRELVEQLNKLRSAAETLEQAKSALDEALYDRVTILDGLKEISTTHSLRLGQLEQTITDIQATVSNLPLKNDLGDLPDSVANLKDNLEAQQKLVEDTNRRINFLLSREAEQQGSMAIALQPIEARQLSLDLDFKSLYNALLLVQEQIQNVGLSELPNPLPDTSVPGKEPDLNQIQKKVDRYKAQVNWLIILLILQFVVFGGAILAILTAHIF